MVPIVVCSARRIRRCEGDKELDISESGCDVGHHRMPITPSHDTAQISIGNLPTGRHVFTGAQSLGKQPNKFNLTWDRARCKDTRTGAWT